VYHSSCLNLTEYTPETSEFHSETIMPFNVQLSVSITREKAMPHF
jgi:hypothetical protein